MHQLWYDKYRPKNLDHYVWVNSKLKDLVTDWIEKKSIPSVMFAGGPGRGKTSLAELLIEKLNVDVSDVLRLKGAKDNNAETIRTKVQEFCELGGWSGIRIVFFDEADLLSHTAQGMLRTVIDDYSDSVRFIFTCNYPHRIIEALSASRLYRIEIESLPKEAFFERLIEIVNAEDVEIDDVAVKALFQIRDTCYPDLRRAINLLQHSVRDRMLRRVDALKSANGVWETYIRELIVNRADPVREVCKIREILSALSPDEMEDVYRYLYHHGTVLFGDKQIPAIYLINGGQKVHRAALLPDMILLEVMIRLLALLKNE